MACFGQEYLFVTCAVMDYNVGSRHDAHNYAGEGGIGTGTGTPGAVWIERK
jgi:hypothetical protein